MENCYISVMKGLVLGLVLFLITGVLIWIRQDKTEMSCKILGGQWIDFKESCEIMPVKGVCGLLGGEYDDCDSACRNDIPKPNRSMFDIPVCTDQCVRTCIK